MLCRTLDLTPTIDCLLLMQPRSPQPIFKIVKFIFWVCCDTRDHVMTEDEGRKECHFELHTKTGPLSR